MTMVVGHRGARNLWPENSLSGFHKLLGLQADAAEFDVHLTEAGELLVIHDPTLDRTTDHQGPVAALPTDGHRQVILKDSDNEVIPTLDEVLAIYASTAIELHVELKADATGTPYPGLEARVAAAIDAHDLADGAIMTSFSFDVLEQVRKVAPHIRTLNSFHRPSAEKFGLEAGLKTAGSLADIVAVEKSLLAEHWDEIIGLLPLDRLGAWVPNEEEELATWLSCGLRQITTDRPDLAIAVRDRKTTHAH